MKELIAFKIQEDFQKIHIQILMTVPFTHTAINTNNCRACDSASSTEQQIPLLW